MANRSIASRAASRRCLARSVASLLSRLEELTVDVQKRLYATASRALVVTGAAADLPWCRALFTPRRQPKHRRCGASIDAPRMRLTICYHAPCISCMPDNRCCGPNQKPSSRSIGQGVTPQLLARMAEQWRASQLSCLKRSRRGAHG